MMVKKGIILTKKQASELFLVLGNARLKLNGTYKTKAQKFWEDFQDALDLNPMVEYSKDAKD